MGGGVKTNYWWEGLSKWTDPMVKQDGMYLAPVGEGSAPITTSLVASETRLVIRVELSADKVV